MRLESSSFSI